MFNILNKSEIEYFNIKINQKVINYKKISLIKIFSAYYYKSFKALFVKNSFDNVNNVVVSYTKLIETPNYLENYDKYIVYSALPLSKYQFLKELVYFPLFLIQYLKISSSNKNQIFEAYLNSRLIINNMKKNTINKVVFFGFDYDLTILFATIICNKQKIETVQYCNSGYLAKHNLIIANKIYCMTKIHKNYMLIRNDLFLTKEENINYLIKPIREKNFKKGKIAVYTSGYYARVSRNVHQKNFILYCINQEKKMIELVKKYAIKYKHIDITLFIHLHNDIENIHYAKKYYSDLLTLENIRLQNKNENSIENFHKYELGLCYRSEIFFNRYERGYKTILFGNNKYINDFTNNTSLKNIVIDNNSSQKNIESINKYLNMSTSKYFSLLNTEIN